MWRKLLVPISICFTVGLIAVVVVTLLLPASQTRRGQDLLLRNQPQPAIREFNKVIKSHHSSSETYEQRGLALSELGDYKRAHIDFSVALGLDEHNDSAMLGRAASRLKLGDPAAALADVNRYLAKHPDTFDAIRLRAIIFCKLKRYDLAREDCATLLAMQPKARRALMIRSYANFMDKKFEDCIADLDRIIAAVPSSGVYLMRACCMQNLKRYKEAIADFTVVLKRSPSSSQALFNRADCEIAMGDKISAKKDLEAILHRHPDFHLASQKLKSISGS